MDIYFIDADLHNSFIVVSSGIKLVTEDCDFGDYYIKDEDQER